MNILIFQSCSVFFLVQNAVCHMSVLVFIALRYCLSITGFFRAFMRKGCWILYVPILPLWRCSCDLCPSCYSWITLLIWICQTILVSLACHQLDHDVCFCFLSCLFVFACFFKVSYWILFASIPLRFFMFCSSKWWSLVSYLMASLVSVQCWLSCCPQDVFLIWKY